MCLTNSELLKPCSGCGGNSFVVVRFFNADDRECYPYFCRNCKRRSPVVEKRSVAEEIGFIEFGDL